MGTSDATPNSSSPAAGTTITVDGLSYTVGATISFGRRSVVVVGVANLEGSLKAGVAKGDYLVVSEQVGDLVRYRALVGTELYSIRQYGTPNAVIAKHRESGAPRRSGRGDGDGPQGITLGAQAQRTLDAYLQLSRTNNGDDLVSRLVVEHLGPEVDRLRKTQAAIQQLPMDLLTLLSGLSDDQRAKLMADLRS